jgi:hypothetical protein
MMMAGTAKRVDRNQAEIVRALRQAGASVTLLHEVGAGCPDLLVGFLGVNYLLEVKTLRGRLNDRERAWHRAWRGRSAVVRTVEEALKQIGVEVIQ